jgi:hypothetical protein
VIVSCINRVKISLFLKTETTLSNYLNGIEETIFAKGLSVQLVRISMRNHLLKYCAPLILFVLAVILMTGCTKEGEVSGRYYLTEEMKKQNPYYGLKKLYFKTSEGDRFVMVPTNRLNGEYKVFDGMSTTSYFLIEENLMWFYAENEDIIFLEMEGKVNGPPQYYIKITRDKVEYPFQFDLPLSPVTTPLADSMLVMGEWRSNLFYCLGEHTASSKDSLYYSTTLGIVRVVFNDGLVWDLDRVGM